ncbi:uncharacterized protein ARMOST_21153 [Armillaria ostoyae]|uniref:MYND-type domain-containing protein n=1 Tax=Armillaria ostoyae TaxID=47428 RepID=A0A284S9C5_ARMOS|nr:uncharacterized protein ARMOST_21153 [Armillaria ostoyae]
MDSATASAAQDAPRAYLDGVNLPVDYKMPDPALVRNQAAKVTELMQAPIPPRIPFINIRGEPLGLLPPAFWYNSMCPHLFQFSYLCFVEDVPEDILPQCIWSLEWIIRAFLEGSDEQLRICGHLAPQGQGSGMTTETSRYFTLSNCRNKLANHLLKPQINQPLEALRYIRCSMEADKERSGKSDILLINPGLYELFAVCLARARTDDVEAKAALLRIIRDPTFGTSESGTTGHHVQAKVYLARVLRRLGEDNEARKLEIWLVRWFKKHPHGIKDSVLVPMFTTDVDPAVDPVFVGLGGSKWLDHRKAALKIQIIEKRSCRNCRASEPQVKLSKCSKCKYTSYCSTECSKMNWRYHKYIFHYTCFMGVLMTLPNDTGHTAGEHIGLITRYDVNDDFREDAACFLRLADLQRKNAFAARQFRDWMNFRDNRRPEMEECFAHALGLAGDASRGRTHIIYQEVEYVPSVMGHLDQFRTTGVGVFKLEDVWQDIETRMGLDPGEGKVYIREMLKEFDHTSGQGRVEEAFIPIFVLIFSAKKDNLNQGYLAISRLSQKKVLSMQAKPDWRQYVNMKGELPVHIKLGDSKILDAEYIF